MSDMLTAAEPPWVLQTTVPTSEIYELSWKYACDGFTTRVLRGSRMKSLDALYGEVGAALQFPDYFGENWDATAECLTDLSWLPPGRGYILFIAEADAILTDEPHAQLQTFLRIIEDAAHVWATPVEDGQRWDRPAVAFHAVLQIGSRAAVLQPWSSITELDCPVATHELQ